MRDYREPGRQVGYLRRVVRTEVAEQVAPLLEEESPSIEKLGNACVITNNRLYYAHGSHLYTLPTRINELIQNETQDNRQVWKVGGICPQKVMDLHHSILELKVLKEHLLVRTARSLVEVHPVHPLLTHPIVNTAGEIVHHAISRQGDHIITTLNYPQSMITLYPARPPGKETPLCRIDGLVNTVLPLTRQDYLITTRKQMLLHDSRTQRTQIVKTQHSDTIYGAIGMDPYLVLTCQSQHFALHDIRKPEFPCHFIPHHCSETPPHIMQVPTAALDSDPLSSPPSPNLLVAHSPYDMGSTLLATLDPSPLTQPRQHLLRTYQQHLSPHNQPQLLYDTGKIRVGYHPRSVAVHCLDGNSYAFVHVDNHQGVVVEVMRSQANLAQPALHKHATEYEFMQREPLVKAFGLDSIQDANVEWMTQHTLKKQLEPEKQYWEQVWEEEGVEWEEESNPVEKRTVRYANLTSFFHQLHHNSATNNYP